MNDEIQALVNLYLDLKKNRFWGNINVTLQNGEVVLIKKEQIYKVKDLSTVSIEITTHI